MKRTVIFLSIFVLHFSCAQKNTLYFSHEPFFEVSEEIKHQILNIDSTFICGVVIDMEILDSLLIVEDFIERENAINVYNHHTGQIIDRFGFIGRGPGELIFPSFNFFVSANKIQLYDPNLKKLCLYNLNNNETQRISEYSLLDSKIDGWIKEAVKVDDHFICLGEGGTFDDNRFVVLDSSLNIIYRTGEYPTLIEGQSQSEIQDVLYYVRHLALKPDKTKIAYASYIGAVLEIFNISEIEKDIDNVKTIKIFPPIYNRINNNVTWGKETIIGFEDLYATDNFIYALLNGCLGAEYQYPKSICVFDWDGNPIKKYITDVPLRSIAVDESSKTIFGVTHSEESLEFVYFHIK